MSNLLKGKKGLIMGLANERSLAWGVAKALSDNGAKLAFSYPSEIIQKRVIPLAKSMGHELVLHCDVSQETSVENMFANMKKEWESIDFIIHSIAFSDKKELSGPYMDLSLKNFLNAMHISCYSFTQVAREASKILNPQGSLVTMSYYGSEKVIPHYNVMGPCKAALECSVQYLSCDLGPKNIRVNAISAGPIKTLASSGISGMRYILKWNKYNSPLKRNTTIEDVGNAALFLTSDLSSGTTGEVLHVDCGYHGIGMKMIDAPDISVVQD